MAKVKITLDSAGLSAVLTSAGVAGAVKSAGERAAAAARSSYPSPHSDGPVEVAVHTYTASGGGLRGRRAAVVLVAQHPAALCYEARYGTLRKAAATAGLEVKAKGGR